MVESNSWTYSAVCRRDDFPSRWLSSDIDDINYAKDGCRKCTVRPECLISAISKENGFIGVNAGMSEIEFLMTTWKEVDNESESNWEISDTVIRNLLQRIA